jgi:CRISPR/Cas system-associated exonuclease Cas4 (RecB family)
MKSISKSSFIRGIKCPKALYLHFFQQEERDESSESQQNIFNIGHNAGELAQQLFPGGIDASRGEPGDVQAALEYTRELIIEGQEVIYEAAFSDGETLCYIDILVKKGEQWFAYEVKASTQLKDYHMMDVSFQYYVITCSGLPLSGISLVHINNQYVRRGELDVWQLFSFENLTVIAEENRSKIKEQLMQLQQMIESGTMPEIKTGSHCHQPFSCDFAGFCHQDEPVFLLSDIKGINKTKALDLHNQGIKTFADIPEHFPFTGKEWQLAEAEMEQKEIRNLLALENFTARLEYPLYFMDFETIMPAIPLHNETRPYQQIPFQFSLHIQEVTDGPVSHFEYLGTPPEDPRERFISELLWYIGSTGSILVYNQAFEVLRLREIARDLPAYAEKINLLFGRIVDLMSPFRSRQLYHPDMKGSYSIKKVLPALVPELSYNDLEISEGGTASLTYMSLYEDTDLQSVSVKRENLLRYCELDTLAMVKLLEKM